MGLPDTAWSADISATGNADGLVASRESWRRTASVAAIDDQTGWGAKGYRVDNKFTATKVPGADNP
jgi:hypothetical protein